MIPAKEKRRHHPINKSAERVPHTLAAALETHTIARARCFFSLFSNSRLRTSKAVLISRALTGKSAAASVTTPAPANKNPTRARAQPRNHLSGLAVYGDAMRS